MAGKFLNQTSNRRKFLRIHRPITSVGDPLRPCCRYNEKHKIPLRRLQHHEKRCSSNPLKSKKNLRSHLVSQSAARAARRGVVHGTPWVNEFDDVEPPPFHPLSERLLPPHAGGPETLDRLLAAFPEAGLTLTAPSPPPPPLELFRAAGKGWGVRALCDVPAGTVVGEYAGEVVSAEEARRRLAVCDAAAADCDVADANSGSNSGGGCYVLCMREVFQRVGADGAVHETVLRTVIDASHMGNLTRFINHACPARACRPASPPASASASASSSGEDGAAEAGGSGWSGGGVHDSQIYDGGRVLVGGVHCGGGGGAGGGGGDDDEKSKVGDGGCGDAKGGGGSSSSSSFEGGGGGGGANLEVQVGRWDSGVGHLLLVARQRIPAGCELTFSYADSPPPELPCGAAAEVPGFRGTADGAVSGGMAAERALGGGSSSRKPLASRTRCLCGGSSCWGWLSAVPL